MVLIGKYWLEKRDGFPYGPSSADVQILLKEHTSAVGQRYVYLVKAGDIEGEAVLTSAPTSTIGRAIVDSQIVGVTSPFENSVAPYPGQITSLIACNTRKYVKEQNFRFGSVETKLVLAVASARRIFGSCSADEIKHAAIFWAAYDEQRRQVVTVKLFKPISGPDNVAESQQEILRIFRKIMLEN